MIEAIWRRLTRVILRVLTTDFSGFKCNLAIGYELHDFSICTDQLQEASENLFAQKPNLLESMI